MKTTWLDRVRSLGYRTDAIFWKFHAEITETPDYVWIQTPHNPTYFWGNLLFFFDPPKAGDFGRWIQLFQERFGDNPEIRHLTFGWDATDGKLGAGQAFLDAGFELEDILVLKLEKLVKPTHYREGLEIRPLVSDLDWSLVEELQFLCGRKIPEPEHYREFKRNQMANYRRMTQAGLGDWFGLFLDGDLVADLGLFWEGDVGRFQSVETHPKYRREGLCHTLVYEVTCRALREKKPKTIVIAAEREGPAFSIYQRLGYKAVEQQLGVWHVDAAQVLKSHPLHDSA